MMQWIHTAGAGSSGAGTATVAAAAVAVAAVGAVAADAAAAGGGETFGLCVGIPRICSASFSPGARGMSMQILCLRARNCFY